MTRKLRIVFFVTLFAGIAAFGAKPNVIFILTDDLGFGDVGWTWKSVAARKVDAARGECRIQTPNLDRLAEEGVVMNSHYCAAPVCAPSRASILTGVKQRKCSVHDNMFDHPITEPETLATVMKRAGYRTMAIGKWGVGGGGESGKPVSAHPLDKGFDSYYGFMDHLAGHTYYHYDGYLNHAYMGLWNGRVKATEDGVGVYSTDLFIARAKREISAAVEENRGKPFFLYLAVNTVHGSGRNDASIKNTHPLHVPGRAYPKGGVEWPLEKENLAERNTWIDPRYRYPVDGRQQKPGSRAMTENMQRYATAVSRLDDAIGDLMRHLEKLGVIDETIVIFTSDNGPAAEYGADPRAFASTGPFDGFKRDVYEGGVRVPTFVWRKGGFAVKEDAEPSIAYDWMPTLADFAGVAAPKQCDGVSLKPRLEGRRGEKSKIEIEYRGFPQTGVAAYDEFAVRKGYAVRGEEKMRREGDVVTLEAGGKPPRRYDVVKDPHQDSPLD